MAGSKVVKLSLGSTLRRMRRDAHKTAGDVWAARIMKEGKLGTIERGEVAPSVPDVKELCRLYGADEPTITRLADMAVRAEEGGGWWEGYGDAIPQWFTTYVELEAAAAELRAYDGELVPGLLQTPGYHAALFQPGTDPNAIAQQLEVRSQRQRQALERRKPLVLNAVLGHGAVTRRLGGGRVMDDQLRHLRSISETQNVQVRVMPADAGVHPGMRGAFNLLEFSERDVPRMVYMEALYGARYEDRTPVTDKFAEAFEMIWSAAVTIEEYMR